jgi:hypothetical protein
MGSIERCSAVTLRSTSGRYDYDGLWKAGDEISLHEARSYKFILPLRERIVFDMLDYSVFDDVF